MIIILLIFVSVILADLILAVLYGWIAYPKLFCLRGLSIGMFFDGLFYFIVALALYSWFAGPEYVEQSDGKIISIGTWDIHGEWIEEGRTPYFKGYLFFQPILLYIPR